MKAVRLFAEDTARYQLYSAPNADQEWEALVPADGMVYMGQDDQPYMVSMFHQLQCLDVVRRQIVHQSEDGADRQPKEHDALTRHCLNYLRQMVLCRGDTQLDVVYGRPRPVISPDEYQCLDWTVVYDAVRESQGRRPVV